MIEYMKASFMDVVKHKIKWLINIVLKVYNKYIELYDFDNFI
nr:MAG TPA: hypothetical protein [Caudoviricetes sp.]DAX95511.1 MAG TPA: hypothetical protein [Caudoviricetes sp.]